ncbi:MAG TPA: hypothetical protein VGP07_10055 [Polyangia bacterium]
MSQAHTSPSNVPSSSDPAPSRSTVPTEGEGLGVSRSELVALADSLSHQVEATDLAAREKKAPNLQSFNGGGVEIYIGSGATLVLVIILLIILL